MSLSSLYLRVNSFLSYSGNIRFTIGNTFDFLSATTLTAGYNNGKIKVWNFDNSTIQESWHAHEDKINKILFMPQSRLIISSGNDGYVKIWKRN